MEKKKTEPKSAIGAVYMFLLLAIIFGGYHITQEYLNLQGAQRIVTHSLAESGGDGLYADNSIIGKDESLDFASKYYFKGENVNNYFWYDNHCFLIMSINNNDTLKVVHIGTTADESCQDVKEVNKQMPFSTSRNNSWTQSNIYSLLNDFEEEEKLFDEKINLDVFVEGDWYSGMVDSNSQKDMLDHISDERNSTYTSKIGIITLSEYLKASSGVVLGYGSDQVPSGNYLFRDKSFWTMSADRDGTERVFGVTKASELPEFSKNDKSISRVIYADTETYTIYPALYLNSGFNYSGTGTPESPYKIK